MLAYNLEWFDGRFHTAFWLAAAWGAFPVLTGYWVNALELRVSALLAAIACFMLTIAQRRLSTPVRELRRRTVSLSGEQRLADGSVVQLDAARLAAPLEGALGAWALGVVLLASGWCSRGCEERMSAMRTAAPWSAATTLASAAVLRSVSPRRARALPRRAVPLRRVRGCRARRSGPR